MALTRLPRIVLLDGVLSPRFACALLSGCGRPPNGSAIADCFCGIRAVCRCTDCPLLTALRERADRIRFAQDVFIGL